MNTICAVTFALSYEVKKAPTKSIRITALVLTAPLWVSWLFLTDAFRRFKNTKTKDQVVNNITVGALSFAYLLYAVG